MNPVIHAQTIAPGSGIVVVPGESYPLMFYEGNLYATVLEVFAPAFMGDYDVPEEREEWRWIQAEATFEHVGNGIEEGVWEFMLPVRRKPDLGEYMSTPPARLAEILAWAREHGYPYILFHQG